MGSIDYILKLSDMAGERGIEKCISKVDNDRVYLGKLGSLSLDKNQIRSCLDNDGLLENVNFKVKIDGDYVVITSDSPNINYESYHRFFLFQNTIKRVVIEIEKIDMEYLSYR